MDYIETIEGLETAIRSIEREALLAVDTEAAGYHRYADSVCLVQMSTRSRTWIVDALAVDVGMLRPLLADGREILLHDADYDLRLLARDHGIRVGRLFDTKVAAQFLGEPAIGLANLVEKYIGVRLDKKHQRADWAQRPLRGELIEYAADDTRHLPPLRDCLRDRLNELDRLRWAEEEFDVRANATPAFKEDETAFLRVKNTRDLAPRQLAALREIYAWRDGMARDRDLAPFRVLSNDAMIAVARRMPRSISELRVTDGADAAAQRHGRDLLDAVQRARDLADDALPVRRRGPRRPPPDPLFDSRVDRIKAVRDRVAEELGVDRGFLLPRQQIEDIVKAAPRTIDDLSAVADLRRWQVEAIGEPVIRALR